MEGGSCLRAIRIRRLANRVAPRRTDPMIDPPHERQSRASDTHERARPGALRVLAVDDSEMVLSLIARLVRLLEFECDTARNLREARAHLARASYDVLVLDLTLGRELGTDLFDELERAARPLARRAIVLTADLPSDPWIRALVDRGVTVVHKPFQLPEFERHLRALALCP